MKDSFKTFPKIPKDIETLLKNKTVKTVTIQERGRVAQAFIELAVERCGWKERLEKELREYLDECEVKTRRCSHIHCEKIREILGE